MIFGLAFVLILASCVSAQWPRWEERTLNCTNVLKTDQCILVAPKAKVARDPVQYKCHREKMPQNEWNPLAKGSETRLACPIGCEPLDESADLSVLQKRPYVNKKCQKYYTYGKYRKENEWYLWITEPCLSSIQTLTTHCRFKDIPINPEQKLDGQKSSVELS